MGLKDDLTKEVATTFKKRWEIRDGRVVPEPKDVGLGNIGVNLDAAVLYADIDGSTSMVDDRLKEFAAEVYKTYLLCAVRIIKAEGGVITAYDGDRVMALFITTNKETDAVRAALKIKWAVTNIINAKLKECYPSQNFTLQQVVGVDTGKLMAAQTGIRGSNDLVWVGPAANWAAKMCATSEQPYQTFISKAVYDAMLSAVKYTNETNMWEARLWKGRSTYRSSYSWPVG